MAQTDTLDFLIAVLSGQKTGLTATEQVACLTLVQTLIKQFTALTPDNQQVVKQLADAASGHPDAPVRALAMSMGAMLYNDPLRFRRGVEQLLEGDHRAENLNSDLMTLMVLRFQNIAPWDDQIDRDIQVRLYRKLRETLKAELTSSGALPVLNPGKNGRIAILASQILMPPHSPTVNALRFARMFEREDGMTAKIFSTLEFSPKAHGTLAQCVGMTAVAAFAGEKRLDFEGHQTSIYHPPQMDFSPAANADLLRAIKAFEPDMIFVIGSTNVIADILSEQICVFRRPTTADVPIQTSGFYHTWRDPTPEMFAQMDAEGIRGDYLFAKHPGFELPVQGPQKTRTDFGLPEDKFIFNIVSMRLHADLDPDCLAMLDRLAAHEHIHIAFAGDGQNVEGILAPYAALSAKSSYHGFQDDIMAFYAQCDAAINPVRIGCGGTIVYALAAGLPVIGTRFGDGGVALGDFPELENYGDIEAAALDLMTNEDRQIAYSDIAVNSAKRYIGIRGLGDKILDVYRDKAPEFWG